jgi:RimJ/RimL family protein N-acetyltransferase
MVELVQYNELHKESLIAMLNDPEVLSGLLHLDLPYTEENAKWWINHCKETRGKGDEYLFAIESEGRHIGGIGLHKRAGHNYEIGYWVGKQHWRKGYASEAIRIITDFGFSTLNLVRIHAYVFEHNIASEKALLKNGYELEGLLKKVHEKNGIYYNSKLFSRIKE